MSRLSVVIASHNAASVIAECLTALETQSDVDETIVADSSTDGTDQIVREKFSRVKLLHFAEPLTLPQLRGHAIAATCGQVIAILDAYSIVDAGWASYVIAEHQAKSNWVIGGTVDLYDGEHQDILTWATYINEYGMFMSPMDAGEIEILPGSNISYKRAALFDGKRPRYAEFWKTFVNWNTESNGSALWLAPKISIRLNKPIPFREFLRSRFDHGRCFAGMRCANESSVKRWMRAATTIFLPVVFLWRWGKRYGSKKRYRAKFVLTLPLQLLLFGNWSLGECFGYVWGAGKSCQKLFY